MLTHARDWRTDAASRPRPDTGIRSLDDMIARHDRREMLGAFALSARGRN